MIPVEYRTVALPDFNLSEILRYAKTASPEGLPLDECLSELRGLQGAVASAEFDITRAGETLFLGFGTTDSKDLSKALGKSEKALVFAATVGLLPDQLISRYTKVSPIKALLLQAIAAERIEALCDCFFQERKEYYKNLGKELLPRFSPGYGDLSLGVQKELLDALDARRLLGITLTESLLMMPSKSVTAIAGISFE